MRTYMEIDEDLWPLERRSRKTIFFSFVLYVVYLLHFGVMRQGNCPMFAFLAVSWIAFFVAYQVFNWRKLLVKWLALMFKTFNNNDAKWKWRKKCCKLALNNKYNNSITQTSQWDKTKKKRLRIPWSITQIGLTLLVFKLAPNILNETRNTHTARGKNYARVGEQNFE